MSLANAFAPVEAAYKVKMMEATWGHLAPKRNTTYCGRLIFAVGCFGSDPLNPIPIVCEFEGLDSSPWFYEAVQSFMQAQKTKEGCVYEFRGSFRNYAFRGKIRKVLDANQEG